MPANALPKTSRCLLLDNQHRLTFAEKPLAAPGSNQVVVAIRANGICGSDIHFYQDGRLGNFVVREPYTPGHEACGEIIACGEDVSGLKAGDAVVIEPGIPCGHCLYCRGGRYNLCPEVVFLSAPPTDGTLTEYLLIRADAVWKMPAGLSWQAAALAEPTAVAVHAVQRARFSPGATALVVGVGPIGLLTLQAFRAAGGGPVCCTDQLQSRLELAVRLGAEAGSPAGESLFDVVFDTSGSAEACAGLFQRARPGGCVVQVGWPAGNQVSCNIADFIERELDYVAVNRYANAFPAALQWIADGRIQVQPLISHVFAFDDAARAFQVASDPSAGVIKAVVINEQTDNASG